MHSRTLGRTGERVSILGFGAMRLPVIDGDPTHIDEDLATRMIRYAIDHGVNYLDTAFPYHGKDMSKPGESEKLVGRALGEGYRERVQLATKLPSWLVESREHMHEVLDGQLQRLQTDHIDFYLVHALNKKLWPKVRDLGVLEFLEEAKAAGKIRHVGFSYHDNSQYFREVVDAHPWEFCQIQYNLLDQDFQAGREGLEYAAGKGLGIIVMEPLRGGSLTHHLPQEVLAAYDQASEPKSPAEWALRWLWNQPDVHLVLSGMSTMEQVVENVAVASAETATTLSVEDATILERVQEIFRERIQVDCTACRYCMPCPQGVDIPENFTLYNKVFLTGDRRQSSIMYRMALTDDERASNCAECGQCEEHCPQGIEIVEQLKQVVRTLEGEGR